MSLCTESLVASNPVSVIHGDFYYAQILTGGGGFAPESIGIVDWDESRPGDAIEDIANFLAHTLYLELEHRIPRGFAAHLERQFLDGYGGRVPDDLSRWIACHLLLLAMRPLRSLSEDAEERTRAILSKAESLFRSNGTVKA